MLAVCGAGRPGVVLRPDSGGVGADEDEAAGALRVGGGEEHGDIAALRVAEQGGAGGSDSVHDGEDVVHAFVESWQVFGTDAIGHTGAALIEGDDTGEAAEAVEEAGESGVVPHDFDVGDPAWDVDEVYVAATPGLVGDAESIAARVVGGGH